MPDWPLSTTRFAHGNAWLVLSMPTSTSIRIAGQWHDSWVDCDLDGDALRTQSWRAAVGTGSHVIDAAGASDTLEQWVAALIARLEA